MVETITKCLNEWNATIEALGQGKQTILIRKYGTNINEFLLYPTISYTLKDNFLDSFQENYKDFVKDNSLPNKKDSKLLIVDGAAHAMLMERPYYKLFRERVLSFLNKG